MTDSTLSGLLKGMPETIYGKYDPRDIEDWLSEKVIPELCTLAGVKIKVAEWDSIHMRDEHTAALILVDLEKMLGLGERKMGGEER